MISIRESKPYLDLNGEPVTNANKRNILDAAIDLFSAKGFSGVSVREIAKAVGIKESSLYNHFCGKDELLQTIFAHFRREAAGIMPPREQLDAILERMKPGDFLKQGYLNFKRHIEDPVMGKIWRIVYIEQFRDPLAREIYLQDLLGRTLEFLRDVFARWISMKKMVSRDPGFLAGEYQYPLFAMIHVFTMLRLEGRDTSGIERQMLEHIDYFAENTLLQGEDGRNHG